MPREAEVWPGGSPFVGQRAQRSRTVTARDIQLFTDRVINGDGTVVLDGTAVCYTMPIQPEDLAKLERAR
jgi:hypothetical protein